MGVHLEFLRQVLLFRDFTDADLAAVASLAIESRYERGQVVFSEDDVGQSMYVVKEGQVKVSRWLPSGRELILAFHPPGDYFGEMALLDGQTLPATVTAIAPTTIILFGRAQFLELVQRPAVAMALLRTLCGRCRDAWRQVETLTHYHAEARIRMALINCALERESGRAKASGSTSPSRTASSEGSPACRARPSRVSSVNSPRRRSCASRIIACSS